MTPYDDSKLPKNAAQACLVESILSGNNCGDFDEAGLDAYRRGLTANACRALEVSFPTIYSLIGHSRFSDAAKRYLTVHPPGEGDWGKWGDQFPELLANEALLSDFPYLKDCAALDWHCHQAERTENQTFDLNSLSLMEQNPNRTVLALGMGFMVLPSSYPIVDIFMAHQGDDTDKQALLLEARDKLTSGIGQTAIIWRKEWKANVQSVDGTEARWLTLLQEKITLGAALDQLSGTDFDFQTGLIKAIENRWILGARWE